MGSDSSIPTPNILITLAQIERLKLECTYFVSHNCQASPSAPPAKFS